jgi:hypothetical protein
MKKLLILIALFSISILSYSQNIDVRETFISILAEECNGYIEASETTELGAETTDIGLPSYYDFELVQIKVSKIIEGYSDVLMIQYWTKDSMNNGTKYIGCFLTINEKLIMVNYFPNNNFIMTYYKPNDYTEL